MFGLITGAQLEATQSNNARRQIFYQYPQGTFPLMGLLSLIDDAEELDKQTHQWFEFRHIPPSSQLAKANTTFGPFTDTTGANGADGASLSATDWSVAAQGYVRVKVADASQFRQRDIVWIKDQPATSYATTLIQIRGVVDAVYTSTNNIDVRLQIAVSHALNNASAYVAGALSGGNYQANVAVIGSAAVEGGYSKLGGVQFPVEPSNYTQTYRTVIGPFTRNALKEGQVFDNTGIYRHACKEAHLRHMEAMEYNCFFGVRGTNLVQDSDDGVQKTEKTTGGLLYFLQQWELGTTGNGAMVNYRPGGADLTTTAWNGDDNKRVCLINGTVSKTQFLALIERIFHFTGDGTWEKLVICGNNGLTVFNNFAERNAIKVTTLNEKETTYGMQVTKWDTIYGTLYFKTHPLFTYNPMFQYSMFVVDMSSIMYHAFQDSDTELLTNRQSRDFDGRKDEWLTEFGLEIKFPERHMYIEGLTGITN